MIDLIDRSEVLYKFAEILPEADSLDWYEQAKPDEVKDLYGIDEISVDKDTVGDDRIDFISNGQTLSIGYFTNGEFRRVRSFYGDYEPQR